MSKKIFGTVIAVLIVSAGFFLWMQRSDVPGNIEQTPSVQTPPVTPVTPVSGPITVAMVSSHNSASSCGTIIDGNVYDRTTWIPRHPGGEKAILGLCGTDGTAAFHNAHDDAKRQADVLATFKIGVLAH